MQELYFEEKTFMRIAFIYKFFPSLGGVERVITTLANGFVREGVYVRIYSFRQPLQEPAYPLDSRISIVPLPSQGRIDSLENISFLSQEIKEQQIDILFNHDSVSDSVHFCHKVKKLSGVKFVTIHHGQIFLPSASLRTIAGRYGRNNLRNILFPLYCIYDIARKYIHHHNNIRMNDMYVVLSETYRRQLDSGQKVQVVANPLSFGSCFEMDRYGEKENLVIMVGRLSEVDKRFSTALDVWKRIEADRRYNNWTFEIVGDGDDRDYVAHLIDDRRLERVRMVGRAASEPYYTRAKIFMMTSAFEGFPLVLLEASQKACVPVVMDSFETVHDLLISGENGEIVKNNDVEMFTEKVKLLMSDSRYLCSMAENAVRNSSGYASEVIVRKWLDLFNKVLES